MQRCAKAEREVSNLKAQMASLASAMDARAQHDDLDKQAATQQLVSALEQVSHVSEQNVQAIKALEMDTHDMRKTTASIRDELTELSGAGGQQQSSLQVQPYYACALLQRHPSRCTCQSMSHRCDPIERADNGSASHCEAEQAGYKCAVAAGPFGSQLL